MELFDLGIVFFVKEFKDIGIFIIKFIANLGVA